MARIVQNAYPNISFLWLARGIAWYTSQHSEAMPSGYSTRKVLYLSQVQNLGTPTPDSEKTKYEYRITSVTDQASSMVL